MVNRRRTLGFTLIEILIVTAIIGILMAVAIPSYQRHIVATRRADVAGAMLSFAASMERWYTEHGSYCDAGATVAAASTPPNNNDCVQLNTQTTDVGDVGAPTFFARQVPMDNSAPAYYNLTISAATGTTFTLQATPVGSMSNDACGNFTLTQTGSKGVTGSAALADCW